ncbi:MAG: ArsC/Spx/MgsR family protein [Bacteroidota bacterium]
MKKVYYLSTCDTCRRILKELDLGHDFQLQDIKHEKITEEQLDQMRLLSGSYESLFSRVARKYKELGLKDKNLGEKDYKNYILDEYTFLKRPVFLIDDQIFIGNSKSTVLSIKEYLDKAD